MKELAKHGLPRRQAEVERLDLDEIGTTQRLVDAATNLIEWIVEYVHRYKGHCQNEEERFLSAQYLMRNWLVSMSELS